MQCKLLQLGLRLVAEAYLCPGSKLSGAVPAMVPGTLELDHRRAEESFMVLRITFSGSLRRRVGTNTLISNINCGSWMHCWPEKNCCWQYYGVGEVFMENI